VFLVARLWISLGQVSAVLPTKQRALLSQGFLPACNTGYVPFGPVTNYLLLAWQLHLVVTSQYPFLAAYSGGRELSVCH
jgi:hypothetical protein